MSHRWARLPALLVLAAALLAPAPAAALVGRFTFPATHGYRATLTAFGFGANLRLTRTKGRKPKRASWVYYIARASGGGDRIDARFGDLGQLHMRFAPNGTVTNSPPQSGCRGADNFTYRQGNLVGSSRFKGEGAYTSIDAHRGFGTTASPATLHCPSSGEEGVSQGGGASRQTKLTTLVAGWHLRLRAESFSATRRGQGPTRFEATESESGEGLAIFRRVLLRAPLLTSPPTAP